MSSWASIFAETKDFENVNEFICDLQSLMEKHNVWMNVTEAMDGDGHVVEFNHIGNEDQETDWWIEMVDLWPHSTVVPAID